MTIIAKTDQRNKAMALRHVYFLPPSSSSTIPPPPIPKDHSLQSRIAYKMAKALVFKETAQISSLFLFYL